MINAPSLWHDVTTDCNGTTLDAPMYVTSGTCVSCGERAMRTVAVATKQEPKKHPRWPVPAAEVVRVFEDKSQAWRPRQQRARDGI